MIKRIITIISVLLFVICLLSNASYAGDQSASGKTTTSLITEAKDILNDDLTNPYWLNAELLRWLNSGVQEVIEISGCLETSQMETLTAGVSEYAISLDYVRINDVFYQSGLTTFKVLAKEGRSIIGRIPAVITEPEYWYEAIGAVGIYPMVDSDTPGGGIITVSGNTIYIILTALQADLTSGSAIPTPSCFDSAIVYYILKQAFLKDRQGEMAKYYETKYQQKIAYCIELLDKSPESLWDIIKPRSYILERKEGKE